MDIQGRGKINAALEAGLLFTEGSGHWFVIQPQEHELIGGRGASEDSVDSVRFVDIDTHANPARVLESLRKAHVLEPWGYTSTDVSPKLKLLGISSNGRTKTLSFEDTAQV